MWWQEGSLLAIGMSDGGEREGGAYSEEVIQFSLMVDRVDKVVKISKRQEAFEPKSC